MKKKSSYIGIIALIVIAALGSWYFLHARSKTAPSGFAEAPTALPQTGTYVLKQPYYTVAANYPTTTPLSGSANFNAVKLMQGWIQSTISQFQTDSGVASITPEQAAQMGVSTANPYTLQIVYLIGSSAHTVSYIFTWYEDTGGAHGNSFFKTFTFDTQTGAALSLADVFTPGSPYLSALSNDARAALTASLAPNAVQDMIDSGTTPDAKNFQDFFFDNKNFVLLFAPYQVAPYAAGSQTVRIPTSQLPELKTQYQ